MGTLDKHAYCMVMCKQGSYFL